MDLIRVGFNYEIKRKKFTRINYEFSIRQNDLPTNELANSAKKHFGELERILDEHYTGRGFTKEEDGSINPNIISCGYEYSNYGSMGSWIKNNPKSMNHIKLEISTYSGEYPIAFKVAVDNHDADSKRLFTVYGTVLSLPGLIINTEAQHQIDNINFLREQRFDMDDLNKYLALPQDSKS
jgi:hypothetical protein